MIVNVHVDRYSLRFNRLKNLVSKMETWRKIPGFEHYEVSDLGQVRSCCFTKIRKNGRPYTHKGKILTQTVEKDGYFRVSLYINKRCYVKKVHRLVYESFIGKPNEGLLVDHINNNRKDNRLCNLQAITNADNLAKDTWRHRKRKDLPLGVSKQEGRRYYTALYSVDGKSFYLGSFPTAEDAAEAYQKTKDEYLKNGTLPIKLNQIRNMTIDGYKICPCCGRNLPLSDYYSSNSPLTKGQRQSKCKECVRMYERERKQSKRRTAQQG